MTSNTMPRSRPGDARWMTRGSCLGLGDLPWTADPETTTAWDRLTMAAVCQECPVLTDCARFATSKKMTAGFWAGTPRDADPRSICAGPGWAIDALPGLGGLGGAA
jgi:hypothetical protein